MTAPLSHKPPFPHSTGAKLNERRRSDSPVSSVSEGLNGKLHPLWWAQEAARWHAVRRHGAGSVDPSSAG
jgi:hypothetical protein